MVDDKILYILLLREKSENRTLGYNQYSIIQKSHLKH